MQLQARVDSGENRPGSLKAIKESFVKLKAEFGSRLLSEITAQDLERWLAKMPLALRTKKRHRGYALQIFNAAKLRKLIVSNPVEEIEGYRGRKNDDSEIHILTPEQLKTLLAKSDPEIKPLYAIAAFAGIRWDEIEQTDALMTAAKADALASRINFYDKQIAVVESELQEGTLNVAKTIKKRRRRQRKPAIEPVIVTAEPKTVMQLIFEAQRTELDRLNEALRTKVFESLDF
jgi:hypothetical protein